MNNARKSLSFKKQGRKTIDTSQLVSFMKQPSISYCAPGWKDTKSVFKPKHYLFYNIRELVASYNEEHQEVETTYFKCIPLLQKSNIWFCSIKLQLMIADVRLENATLLLAAVKLNLTKLGKQNLLHYRKTQQTWWILVSAQWKISKCISGQCARCPASNLTHDLGKAILNIQAISYYRWETSVKHMKKTPIQWIWPILKNFSSSYFFLTWPFLVWPVGSLN